MVIRTLGGGAIESQVGAKGAGVAQAGKPVEGGLFDDRFGKSHDRSDIFQEAFEQVFHTKLFCPAVQVGQIQQARFHP